MLQLQTGRLCQLLRGSRPAELGLELACVPVQRLATLMHVRRDADRPCLAGNRPLDGLANPPGGIGRELEALAVVELLDRSVEADDAVLDQIAERHTVAAVALGDMDDEAQIAVDHPLLGGAVATLDALRERDLLGRGQQRVTADLVHEHLQRIRGRRRRVCLVRAFLGRLADLDATLLEGSIERLAVFGLEFVCLGERIELVRAHETLLGGFVEQGLDFRGLQGGTDGGSFRSSEWTERLFAEGRGLGRRSRPLNRTITADLAFPVLVALRADRNALRNLCNELPAR